MHSFGIKLYLFSKTLYIALYGFTLCSWYDNTYPSTKSNNPLLLTNSNVYGFIFDNKYIL